MAVDMAVQASHSQTRLRTLPIIGGIELLLRERSKQHPQTVELHRRQQILEQAIVIGYRDYFAPRNIPQLGSVLQKDGWWKFGQKGLRKIEFHIKALQAREHLDLHLRKNLAAGNLFGMRKRRIREEIFGPHIFNLHGSQGLPGSSFCKPGSRAYRDRLASGHCHTGGKLGGHMVSLFQKLTLLSHHLFFLSYIGVVNLLKLGHRFFGIKRVPVKLEAQHLALIGLVRKSGGGRVGFSCVEDIGLIMLVLFLLRALYRNSSGSLGLLHCIGRHFLLRSGF